MSPLYWTPEAIADRDAIYDHIEADNPTAALAMEQLPKLKNCEAHSSVMLSHVDEKLFKSLGINLTCEPQYETKKLYHK